MDRYTAASYAMEALKKAGAQEARVIASEGYTEELNAEAGEFSLYRTLFNSSLNLKAIKDGKKGTAVINVLEKAAIDEAAAGCIAAAEAGVVDEAEGIAELTENKVFSDGALVPDKDALYDRTQEFISEIKEKYPKVNLEQFITKYNRGDEVFINSNGVKHERAYGYYTYQCMFTGQDGEKSTSFNYCGAAMGDLSRKFLDIGLARQNIEDILKSFDPVAVDGKFTGSLILAPDVAAEMVQTACDSFLGEGVMIEGTSIWKDRLGEAVSHPSLTVRMNPSDSRIICGERYTADGYLSEDMDVIKEGVIKTFLLSRYGSRKVGKPRAKNLSGAMLIEPGDVSLDSMIKGIKKGILVNRFSGGNPAGNGDFSGVAKNSFFIRDGKIAEAVNETMISGNIETMLKSITGISKETVSNGASVLPWIAVDGIVISGK